MSDDAAGPAAWWDDLIADAEARADEYRADGRDAVVLHPGDLTALDGTYDDRVGLSVLLPDDEYERVETLVGEGDLERYEVYRAEVPGHVAFVLALETAAGEALLCPGYYALADEAVPGLFERALAEGSLTVFLRRLDRTAVEVRLDEPSLLAPEGGAD